MSRPYTYVIERWNEKEKSIPKLMTCSQYSTHSDMYSY